MPWGYEGSAQSAEEIKKLADKRIAQAGGVNRSWSDEGNAFLKDAYGNMKRPHIQGDMSASDAIINGDVAAGRANQQAAHDFFANAAAGNGPNIAQQNLNLGLDRVMQQQAAVQPGLASIAAQQAGTNMGSGLVGQAAQGRQQEQMGALSGMGQSTQALQASELGLLNQGVGRAQGQANLDLGSMQQNASAAMENLTLADFYNKTTQDMDLARRTGAAADVNTMRNIYNMDPDPHGAGHAVNLFSSLLGGAAETYNPNKTGIEATPQTTKKSKINDDWDT
jgi:hypothetical protein